ncbi:S-adenosyl-L-methionine-dependent methyltransferase protein [Dioscorea alata]|uniref:S-adenosyl-L-methionine-dependent methyltransferase protein n=1 Tax=Dioscorea alata TaxID=55571 RepID=A0ACB7WMD1_DIOAL|nr:S-adenosyl-L-methionine-dependent methyltransferase protein [Dioscorea alata]
MALNFTDKTKDNEKVERFITHYTSSQRILLVGEGDFSFSLCLARAFGSAKNMVATSLDSQATLFKNYQLAEVHLQKLKELNCLILHEVDVKTMHEHDILKDMKFDRIIYNFPHAGHDLFFKERDKELIMRHMELVGAFFKVASKMLNEEGQVHVSHRDDYTYKLWRIEDLANDAELVLKEKVVFSKWDYPGYSNKRGSGVLSDNEFPLIDSFTFKFSLESSISTNSDDDDIEIPCMELMLMLMAIGD